MFKWNLEEYKFKDLTDPELDEVIKSMIDTMTDDEKLETLEANGYHLVKKNIELRNKFLEDVENGLVKNQFNFNSVMAWRRKNGIGINTFYGCDYDEAIYLRSTNSWSFPNVYFKLNTPKEKTSAYINMEFKRMIYVFRRDEINHFMETDEYMVEGDKLSSMDSQMINRLDVYFIWDSNTNKRKVLMVDNSGEATVRRELTLEEVKKYNEFFDNLKLKLEEFYNKEIENFKKLS